MKKTKCDNTVCKKKADFNPILVLRSHILETVPMRATMAIKICRKCAACLDEKEIVNNKQWKFIADQYKTASGGKIARRELLEIEYKRVL